MPTPEFFTIGLPQLPINTDPRIEIDLRDIYNAIRTLKYQIEQYGGFAEADEGRKTVDSAEYTASPMKRRLYVEALEVMPYGALVNLTDSGGTLKARFANATTSARPVCGINNTPGNCAIGDIIEVALPGCYVTSVGGLTRGVRYFLTTVDGLMSNAAPAAVGNIVQGIGFAIKTDMLFFQPDFNWYVL